MNVNDGNFESANSVVVVEDPITEDMDQIEIVCPDVIPPGNYFRCHIDVPRGTGLNATIEMVDDVTQVVDNHIETAIPGK